MAVSLDAVRSRLCADLRVDPEQVIFKFNDETNTKYVELLLRATQIEWALQDNGMLVRQASLDLGIDIEIGAGEPDPSGEEAKVVRKQYPEVDEASLRGIVRTNLDSPDPSQSQLDRKARSIAIVKGLDLPYLDHLPVVEDARQIQGRSKREVAQRCVALALCAVKGELQGNDDDFIPGLVKAWSAEPFFSPNEAAFMANRSATQQEYIDNCWGYECAHVLLWALSHLDHLHEPNTICDVAKEMALLRDLGPEAFVEKARLRNQEEILDAADLSYRLHWAAIELRIKGGDSPNVDEGIVRERHRALNWLIRYMNAEWDDVTTDT